MLSSYHLDIASYLILVAFDWTIIHSHSEFQSVNISVASKCWCLYSFFYLFVIQIHILSDSEHTRCLPRWSIWSRCEFNYSFDHSINNSGERRKCAYSLTTRSSLGDHGNDADCVQVLSKCWFLVHFVLTYISVNYRSLKNCRYFMLSSS